MSFTLTLKKCHFDNFLEKNISRRNCKWHLFVRKDMGWGRKKIDHFFGSESFIQRQKRGQDMLG